MTAHAYAGKTAIAGIGATEFSKRSGRSELRLALEACVAALDDAGVEASQVTGLSTFTMETNPETDILRSLGIKELTHFSRVHFGGGAPWFGHARGAGLLALDLVPPARDFLARRMMFGARAW